MFLHEPSLVLYNEMVQVLMKALNSQTWPNCGSIETFSTVSCVVYGPFLEGSDNLTGPQRCSVFIQDGGFLNYSINILSKETKWIS